MPALDVRHGSRSQISRDPSHRNGRDRFIWEEGTHSSLAQIARLIPARTGMGLGFSGCGSRPGRGCRVGTGGMRDAANRRDGARSYQRFQKLAAEFPSISVNRAGGYCCVTPVRHRDLRQMVCLVLEWMINISWRPDDSVLHPT
jgi:hypothetical protein